MVNQQKGVQQDTAYSAVVVNDHMYPRPCLYVTVYAEIGHLVKIKFSPIFTDFAADAHF